MGSSYTWEVGVAVPEIGTLQDILAKDDGWLHCMVVDSSIPGNHFEMYCRNGLAHV